MTIKQSNNNLSNGTELQLSFNGLPKGKLIVERVDSRYAKYNIDGPECNNRVNCHMTGINVNDLVCIRSLEVLI
ncbi:hypothetical protein V1477_001047 [Vespula maculifrons]|uniref:Uncharacterized protein n=1 Tax=Vespula maculifrons TaxID=7453 RepID=A0ABD2D1Y9_VESMC